MPVKFCFEVKTLWLAIVDDDEEGMRGQVFDHERPALIWMWGQLYKAAMFNTVGAEMKSPTPEPEWTTFQLRNLIEQYAEAYEDDGFVFDYDVTEVTVCP